YQHRGGEDSVVDSEVALLRDHGHQVELISWHNDAVDDLPAATVALRTIWSSDSSRQVREAIARMRPDVVHVHNSFPLASPSVYWAADRAGVAVVKTLHNFRLMCPQAMLLRDGRVCEECVGRVPWRSVRYRCYRGSGAASAVTATMLVTHRLLGSYRDRVTRYIALNEFCRRKFIEGGLPADRIVLKPNFVASDPPPPDAARDGLLFVGRLSAEKGIETLARAARLMPEARIRVIGIGPDEAMLEGVENIELLGLKTGDEVMQWMAQSVALLLPSVWYENFPRTLVEAFAQGLPVIASRIGALGELIEHGKTGLLFAVGDPADLARQAQTALSDPQGMRRMGEAARRTYETHYTPEANYVTLMQIYDEAIAARRAFAA
ncbi:MAG: glycosyltransferase family 4 protein, partial [Burkholderiaceae bacterium]